MDINDFEYEEPYQETTGNLKVLRPVKSGRIKARDPEIEEIAPFPLLTYEEILNFPDPEPLVEDFLNRKNVSLLVGDSSVGKTFLTVAMSLCIATGEKWMGKQVRKGGVLYLMAEGADYSKWRLQMWQKEYNKTTQEISSSFMMIPIPINLMEETARLNVTVEKAVAFFAQYGVELELVVIDTLSMCTAGIEENSSQMSVPINTCHDVKTRFNCHVMIVHHENKQGGYRGFSGLRGNVDTKIDVKAVEDSDMIKIFSDKQRDKAKGIALTALRKVVDTGKIDGFGRPITTCVLVPCDVSTEETSKSVQPVHPNSKGKMLSCLDENGMKNSAWKRAAGDIGVNENTFNKNVQTLLKDHKVIKMGELYYREIDPNKDECTRCGFTVWVYDAQMKMYRCDSCNPELKYEGIK